MKKLTEYQTYKKATSQMEKDPKIQFARVGDYVIVPSKIWDAGVNRIREFELAKMAVRGVN